MTRSRRSVAVAATAAVAAAAAATTVAATAAAAAVAAATAAARPVAFLLRTRFVDRHRTTAVVLTVQLFDRRLRLGIAAHLDEAETLAAAGVAIGDELRGLDRSARGKFGRDI